MWRPLPQRRHSRRLPATAAAAAALLHRGPARCSRCSSRRRTCLSGGCRRPSASAPPSRQPQMPSCRRRLQRCQRRLRLASLSAPRSAPPQSARALCKPQATAVPLRQARLCLRPPRRRPAPSMQTPGAAWWSLGWPVPPQASPGCWLGAAVACRRALGWCSRVEGARARHCCHALVFGACSCTSAAAVSTVPLLLPLCSCRPHHSGGHPSPHGLSAERRGGHPGHAAVWNGAQGPAAQRQRAAHWQRPAAVRSGGGRGDIQAVRSLRRQRAWLCCAACICARPPSACVA